MLAAPLQIAATSGWHGPSAVDLVLLLAIGSNCALILVPMQSSVRAAHDELGAKELAYMLLPTYTLFAQSFLWACYGLLVRQLNIAHFNAFGAALCLAYLGCLTRSKKLKRWTQTLLLVSIAAVVAVSVVVMLFFPATMWTRATVLAYAAMLFGFFQSFTPVVQAIDVLHTGRSASFHIAVAAGSFISSVLWTQYAAMVHDHLYFVSNGLNSLVGALCLVMVASSSRWLAVSSSLAEGRPLVSRTQLSKEKLWAGSAQKSEVPSTKLGDFVKQAKQVLQWPTRFRSKEVEESSSSSDGDSEEPEREPNWEGQLDYGMAGRRPLHLPLRGAAITLEEAEASPVQWDRVL